ncbi:hypothetical protein FB593_11951 [Rhizobium sp. SJZ105]|nr:hypothetical protein FB593_11951 [Rhizobium sp. SJZ105]
MVTFRIDPFPRQDELNMLWLEAWAAKGQKTSPASCHAALPILRLMKMIALSAS